MLDYTIRERGYLSMDPELTGVKPERIIAIQRQLRDDSKKASTVARLAARRMQAWISAYYKPSSPSYRRAAICKRWLNSPSRAVEEIAAELVKAREPGFEFTDYAIRRIDQDKPFDLSNIRVVRKKYKALN